MNRIVYLAILLIATSSCGVFFEENIEDKIVDVIAPADGVVIRNGEVQFFWNEMKGATNYNIQVVSPNFVSAAQVYLDSTVSESILSVGLLPGQYEWKIRGLNNGFESKSSIYAFSVDSSETLTGRKVQLLSPANNLLTNNQNINLTWEAMNGATFYTIELDSNNSPKYNYQENTASSNLVLGEGEWTWRVKAENSSTFSSFSNDRTFTIDNLKPEVASLVEPMDADSIQLPYTFTWTSESGNAIDSIFVYNDLAQAIVVLKNGSNTSNYVLSTLGEDKLYYWNVFTYDLAGNKSDASELRKFYVQP